MDVEQHDVGIELEDQRHGVGDAACLADDLDAASPSSPRTPARNSSWSSTSTTRITRHPGEGQLDLGAWPGSDQIVAVPPARAIRASIDSVMPRRSAGDGAGVEADAAVADEDRNRLGPASA